MRITKIPRRLADVAESGLQLTGAALSSAQRAVTKWTGSRVPEPPTQPWYRGPDSVDQATSELANRTLRLLRYWASGGSGGVEQAYKDLIDAAKTSFAGVDRSASGGFLSFPVQLALSLGTLCTQEAVRLLHIQEATGIEGLFRIGVGEIAELMLDIPVYVSLQYKEEIERFRRRIREAPDDAAAHLELGRSYIKCGLYAEAIEVLEVAATSRAHRGRALYESVIAHHRAGRHGEAARRGALALAEGFVSDKLLFWTWHSARKSGGYPPETRPEHRIEMLSGNHPTELRYDEVAAEIGLDKISGGRGTAIFDYDNDGLLDVLISGVSSGLSLYHNNGDGTFTDVTVGSGLEKFVNSWGITVGDYNNDGFPDVFVTRLGFYWGDPALFRNNGDGTFTNVTKEAGLELWTPGFMASWVDYNNDGLLDLYVPGNFGGIAHRKRPDCLFRNNGDGTFTNVAEQAGICPEWLTIGACWGDYDNDGFPDLFLSSPVGRPSLYHNNGDGTFTDVSKRAGIDAPCMGFNSFFCDYDDDGWLDIVQLVWCPQEHAIHSLRHGRGPDGGLPLRVYHNNRDGTFTDVSRDIGITECWTTMGGNSADLNNNGYLDIVLGNGAAPMERVEPVVVLQNERGFFRNVGFSAGLPADGKGHGTNIADLAGDGRMHILVASGGMYPGDMLTTSVYRPRSLLGNYLNVRLTGTKSNRDAIGARLALRVSGREQHRLVGGGSNFGCLPVEQHFGLGRGAVPESLEIRWPSGPRQRLDRLPVNATIKVVEGERGYHLIKRGPAAL